MRVLLVDDHRNTRESLAMGLALLGHQPDVAAGGEEALRLLAFRAYDWLICDIRMPGMSGIELAGRARGWHQTLGVILMTAYDVSADERPQIDALGGTLVIKPITAVTLAELCEAGPRPSVHSEGA